MRLGGLSKAATGRGGCQGRSPGLGRADSNLWPCQNDRLGWLGGSRVPLSTAEEGRGGLGRKGGWSKAHRGPHPALRGEMPGKAFPLPSLLILKTGTTDPSRPDVLRRETIHTQASGFLSQGAHFLSCQGRTHGYRPSQKRQDSDAPRGPRQEVGWQSPGSWPVFIVSLCFPSPLGPGVAAPGSLSSAALGSARNLAPLRGVSVQRAPPSLGWVPASAQTCPAPASALGPTLSANGVLPGRRFWPRGVH